MKSDKRKAAQPEKIWAAENYSQTRGFWKFLALATSCRLRNFKKRKRGRPKRTTSMARQKGFEPLTPWFVAKYSIQLSYWRFFNNSNIISLHSWFVKRKFEKNLKIWQNWQRKNSSFSTKTALYCGFANLFVIKNVHFAKIFRKNICILCQKMVL